MLRLTIRLTTFILLVFIILVMLSIGIGQSRNADIVTFMAEFDEQTDIYQYDPISRELINLTNSPAPEWSFGWSSNGALLYTATVNVTQAADELFVMTRLGNEQFIDTPDTLYSFGGVWSPDGTTLAYFSSHPRNYSDIYTITFPELTIRNLTETETISESNPLWSPDGTQLLYRLDGDLYLLDVETRDSQRLVDLKGTIEMPVWSPDGQSIAFYIRTWDNGSNVLSAYIVSHDGNDLEQLDVPLTINSPVSWSPDSQRLTMTVDDTNLAIYTIATHSTETIEGENRRFSPAWSPDGRWISFIENRQLNIYDVENDDIQTLLTDGRVKPPLLWQP
ncbi:MAG: hypothetical protein Phog2KO_45930 [Phototrophicaceae bacterium]